MAHLGLAPLQTAEFEGLWLILTWLYTWPDPQLVENKRPFFGTSFQLYHKRIRT